MEELRITERQARRFMLLKHGLLGPYRFRGSRGALEFVRQAGCIQFDPVDVCGKNAEMTLQSRVKGFTKQALHTLLYETRALVDYPDKNTSIIPTEDWPYFERYREAARKCGAQFEGMAALEQRALDYIRANGPVSSASLPIEGRTRWHSAIHWSGDWHGDHPAARAALEQLYSTGKLVIHHKQGARKFYDLAERHVPREILEAPDPLPDDRDHLMWRVKRRIGAVGLMWNRPSDAWLHIWNLDSAARKDAFERLAAAGEIVPAQLDGMRDCLWFRTEDMPIMEAALGDKRFAPRCEVIAPLDPLMWDRKLIRRLFGFHYSWEVYTPADKRRYGYYVLPVIYGENFAGRLEAAAEGDTLRLKGMWLEDGFQNTAAFERALDDCLARLAGFNGCARVSREYEI